LNILFGGVPLVLEEITEPKRDFVRATEEEIWAQCVTDLTYAAENLPDVTDVEDGRLTKAAANHLLSEIYIIQKEYDLAISTASLVIDDSNYALMTERFGSRVDESGDVYWDLFRRGNQNRNEGTNTESIWVQQYEYQVAGINTKSNWFLIPRYWKLTDRDGNLLFVGYTNDYGGFGGGWACPNDYYLYDIWEDDTADIRNSDYNIVRDIAANNTESAYYGQNILESDAFDEDEQTALQRDWRPLVAKVAPMGNFPDDIVLDEETGLLSSESMYCYTDHYIFRLAETYLLRAEAYFLAGDADLAAEDINVIRARANADAISSEDVDLDFILDERARELGWEEVRMLTLMRMGKFVERTNKYNPMHNGTYDDNQLLDYHELWPIPYEEIESNTEAVLEQNPGY
jgi:hypothetical protein